MPVQPPNRQQLEWIADTLHMQLTDEELDVFEAAIGPSLESFRRLDELPDEQLPVKYPRADHGHRPVGDENPSNGWAWKCSIPGAAEGPLAGRTVGVKDNVCVAGMPMLNGSPIMEGYVPARGRDCRHAAARRGRAHRRQGRRAGVLLRRRRADGLSRPAAGEPAQPGVSGRRLVERHPRSWS